MSSKLQNYVGTRRTATPPTEIAGTPSKKERADRAQGVKVGPRISRSRNKAPPTETDSDVYRSTEPSRNGSADHPRTYASSYQPGRTHLEPHNDRPPTLSGNQRDVNGFDNTVSTDFDHTRSESREGSELSMNGPIFAGGIDAHVEYVPRGEDGIFDEDDDYDEVTHHADMHVDLPRYHAQQSAPSQHPARSLHHKEAFAQTKTEEPHIQEISALHGSDIAGRFAGPSQKVQARVEVLAEPERGASKKRGHSQQTLEPNNFPIRSFERKGTGRFESDGRDTDPRNSMYDGFTSPSQAEGSLADGTEHPQNNIIQSLIPQKVGVAFLPITTVPDYSDEELTVMDFALLKAEDWGYGITPVELNGISESDSMGKKLEALNNATFETQAAFFCGLPDEQWDDAGQAITAKIAEIMTKVHGIRKQKREIAAKYEKIYEERVQLVRSKDEKYEAQLDRMKNRGRNLLQ